MKSRFLILFSAAAALTACQIEEPLDLTDHGLPAGLVEVEEPELTTFVFSSGEEDAETKTEHSGSTVIWSEGDQIRMAYTVSGNWQGSAGNATGSSPAKLYASTPLASGGATASFTVPGYFTGGGSGDFRFYTVYPASAAAENFSSAPLTAVILPTEQTPAAESFDPAADLMVGHSIRDYSSKPTEAIPLMWDRKVAHGEITLKNLTRIAGFSVSETIESVTLTAQEGAVLTGSFSLDLPTGEMVATEASNSVTARGDNLSFKNGNLTFWIGIMPVTITALNVTLVTDKATYTRTIVLSSDKYKSFNANAHSKLGINMEDAVRKAKAYYLVESALEDWSGDYVIARTATTGATAGTTYAMGGQNGTNNFSTTQTVTVTENAISLEEGQSLNVRIDKSSNGYTLKFGNYYLGYTSTAASGNNFLYYSTTFEAKKYEWSIAFGEGNLVTITSVYNTDRTLRLNSNSKDRYACYLGTQWNPSLYRLSGGGTGGTTPPAPQPATATVVTGAVGTTTQSSAVLYGSFSGETGAISEVGFYWGESSNPATKVDLTGTTTSPFTYSLSGLSAGTTYYYKAYVIEYNAETGQEEERTGDVVSFTTVAETPATQYYEKVVANRSDWSGRYVLGYLSSETTAIPMAGIGTINSNSVGTLGYEVEVNSGNIAYQAGRAYELTIESTANGYSIKIGGKYLYWNSGNTLSGADNFTATTCEWAISYSGGTLTIASVKDATRLLKYNEGSPRFACYSSNSYSLRSPTLFRLYTSGGGGDTPLPSTPGYLVCNEMPSLSLSGVRNSGNETWNNDGETSGGTFPKWYEYDLSVSTRKIITHTYGYNGKVYRNYTALVDQTKRCPILTCYVLHKGAYPNNDIGRTGSFNTDTSYDPGIPVSWQSSGSTSDYNNGEGYSRGHHCASEDRQTCVAANFQTFYYTNQSPQRQNSFNSGVWSSLEAASQSNAPTGRDTLYVNVGTLFENNNSGSSNDGGTVGRPSHFYKCFMLCSFDASGNMTNARGIAYLYTNEAHSNVKYYDSSFVTTIDAIEQRSGLELFANVPATLQDAAERQTTALWTYQ